MEKAMKDGFRLALRRLSGRSGTESRSAFLDQRDTNQAKDSVTDCVRRLSFPKRVGQAMPPGIAINCKSRSGRWEGPSEQGLPYRQILKRLELFSIISEDFRFLALCRPAAMQRWRRPNRSLGSSEPAGRPHSYQSTPRAGLVPPP